MWRCNTHPNSHPNSNANSNANSDSNANTDTRAERDRLGGRFDTDRSRISFRWQRVELDCC